MADLLYHALLNGVKLDNQTVVQSLLDSHTIPNDVPTASTLVPANSASISADDDVLQCGKCKKQFTSIYLFLNHKKEHASTSLPKHPSAAMLLPIDGNNDQVELAANLSGGTGPSYADGNDAEMGQPIIFSEADILSFSVDQASLNMSPSAQVVPSFPNVQAGSLLTLTGGNTVNSKTISDDRSNSPGDGFSVPSLDSPPIIFTPPQLSSESYVVPPLPSIQSITKRKLSTDTSNLNACGGKKMNKSGKECRILLPNIEFNDNENNTNSGGKMMHYEEVPLDSDTVLLDYDSGQPMKSCRSILPNVEFVNTDIEFIECEVEMDRCQNESYSIVEYADHRTTQNNITVIEEDAIILNVETNDPLALAQGCEKLLTQQPVTYLTEIEDEHQTLEDDRDDQLTLVNKLTKLQCEFCEKVFTKNFDLQQHVRSHTGEKPFQCVVCGRAFSQKSNVKKHMASHKVWPATCKSTIPDPPRQLDKSKEGGNPSVTKKVLNIGGENGGTEASLLEHSYACQFCDMVFPAYLELKSHMKEHSDQKVYKCIQKNCKKTFSDLDAFLGHTNQHSSGVQYRCHICNKKFSDLEALGVHQYSHNSSCKKPAKDSGTKGFLCSKCKRKFATQLALDHHLETASHHFPCPYCGKVFTWERYLRRHLPTHVNYKSFLCSQCGKSFRTEQYLKAHLLTHSAERPYACQHCSATFNRKDKLARHALNHQSVKRFKCPFHNYLGCSREFNRQDKLKRHILTHSASKPLTCKKCNKTFHRPSLLKEHEKTHRLDFDFKCQHCGKVFKNKFHMTSHMCNWTIKDPLSQPKDVVDNINSSPGRQCKITGQKRNQKKLRNTKSKNAGNKVTDKPDADDNNSENLNPPSSGPFLQGDNVPTIEIIVVPVSVGESQNGEINSKEHSVYHVMFPSNTNTSDTSTTDESVLTTSDKILQQLDSVISGNPLVKACNQDVDMNEICEESNTRNQV